MTAPDFDAIAKKMFSFAGKDRYVEILVQPSIMMIADALRDAYESGVKAGRFQGKQELLDEVGK